MDKWIVFLSGNVPGGFFLLLLLLVVTFLILLFMYRVNELFTRRHLVRWSVFGLLLFTGIYTGIWLANPPHFLYKRYTVGLIQSDSKNNWLGEYFTDLLANSLQPFKDRKDYFFPQDWFYRMTPSDSASNSNFMKNAYINMPMQKALLGKIERNGDTFNADLQLQEFPSGKVIRREEGQFDFQNLREFVTWTRDKFGRDLPFKNNIKIAKFQEADSVLVLAKHLFYERRYREAKELLESAGNVSRTDPDFELWYQFARIRLAGEESLESRTGNAYIKTVLPWQKEMESARNRILERIRDGAQSPMADLMVAESYIWEENYGAAEVFLKKMYSENPFQIDVLLNLTFLHPSRYRDLGFKRTSEIYKQVLIYCPVEEAILLKWSDLVLKGNPAYTSPPEVAKEFIGRYLAINPYSPKVWLMLGKIYAQQHLRPDALKAYLKADSLQPGDGLINYNIGVLYYEWEKVDKAQHYFDLSVQYDDYLDSHLYLGAIYRDKGDYEAALKEFRYRVAHRQGQNDEYADQAMKGIRECLEVLGQLKQQGN